MTNKGQPRTKVTLPRKFDVRFLEEADGRLVAIKELRKRVEQLKADTGVDSCQKDLLCRRACFVAAKLESMEVTAIETGKLEVGQYVQGVNCLVGLLRCLGLERKRKQIGLTEYVNNQK